MQNVLKQMKNYFLDFYFSSYGHFVLKTSIFSMNKNRKNWKIDFSFDSAHCASFIKTGAKLKGRGGSAYP